MVCNIPIFFLKNNALLMEISGSTSVYPLPPHMLHHTVYKFQGASCSVGFTIVLKHTFLPNLFFTIDFCLCGAILNF